MRTSALLLLASASSALASFPLAAWTHPLGLLKMAGVDWPLGPFEKTASVVMFMPTIHNCGILQILSAPGLERADLDDVLGREVAKAEWDASPSKGVESEAEDVAVIAWAKGWRETCGLRTGGEVRVAELAVDGLGGEGAQKDEAVANLNNAVAAQLAKLPASPAQHLVILTSLSPSTLQSLIAIAESKGGRTYTPRPPSPKSPSKTPPTDFPANGFFALIGAMFRLCFCMSAIGAIGFVGYTLWMRRKSKKTQAVMLPLTNDDDLDLEAE